MQTEHGPQPTGQMRSAKVHSLAPQDTPEDDHEPDRPHGRKDRPGAFKRERKRTLKQAFEDLPDKEKAGVLKALMTILGRR
ncbi:hypothetical protein JM93_01264 [Roseibium hamelinense]|uniref:Uncharacterized protein n=1 Tax=Roseibium hamelinense TaxID=150831 RepID=A0A562TAR4_9HYPH|nr:hypothetical protein [Roseibium hamelinense]MTI45349.1 hypothetical protein [Roseibium hamelinense]TWI90284.1 hypothetical protein JM93_01264 [Roseibium hamelinense]